MKKSRKVDKTVIGITTKLVPYIAFKPVLVEITTGTKTSKIKNKKLYED